ncbi:MAG: hypothetical protein EOP90_05040 [Lysobacteraceae bacterium]|nr:MAG: hypothetical protein EOP90_05040 [Xanthomonadaceae bacterium]
MPVAKGSTLLVAFVMVTAAPTAPASGPPVLWRSDWYTTAPLTLNHNDLSVRDRLGSIGFAANRDVVLTAPSRQMFGSGDYLQVVRLRPDGSVRWAGTFGEYAGSAHVSATLADADGSATILARVGEPTMIVRFAPNGDYSWYRFLSAAWVARASATRLAAASCRQLSVLDAASGNIVWQRPLGTSECVRNGLLVDAEGNLYVASGLRRDGLLRIRLAKFDATGNELWHVERAAAEAGGLAGIGPSLVYLAVSDELEALRISDGSPAWSAPSRRVLMGAGTNPEPIVIEPQSITRLDADTGKPRWTTPLSDVGLARVVTGSLLLECGTRRCRLDLESGFIVWDVPDETGDRAWLAFGDPYTNTVRAIARPYSSASVAAPYLDYRIDFENGQIVAQLPAVELPQGVDSTSALDADGDVMEFALSQQPTYPALHLRRVHATTGATLWEQRSLLDDLGPEASVELQQGSMATAGDQIAVVVPLSNYPWSSSCGPAGAHVATYDRISGALRWKRLLRDPDQSCTEVSSPALDVKGNVFVSVAARVACDPAPRTDCQRRSLYKLGGLDGDVIWRVDEDLQGLEYGSPSDPKDVHIVGDDPVVMGPFAAESATLRRYSGSDGSVRWSSFEFADTHDQSWMIERIDEGHVIFRARDAASGERITAKIDLMTGATLWRATSDPSPAPSCESYDSCLLGSNAMVMPDGDVLRGIQLNWMPWLSLERNDGSGIIERWQASPGSAHIDSGITRILRDPDGLRATLRRASAASRNEPGGDGRCPHGASPWSTGAAWRHFRPDAGGGLVRSAGTAIGRPDARDEFFRWLVGPTHQRSRPAGYDCGSTRKPQGGGRDRHSRIAWREPADHREGGIRG